MSRAALTAAAAVLAILGAGLTQERRQQAATAPLSATAAPTASPSPAPSSTPTAKPVQPLVTTAMAYASAATNWSAKTYRSAHARRLALAGGRLASDLRDAAPTPAQLQQVRADSAARLGAVLNARAEVDRRRARVRMKVDELHLFIGRRSRRLVTYEARLRREQRWRVVGFTLVRSHP